MARLGKSRLWASSFGFIVFLPGVVKGLSILIPVPTLASRFSGGFKSA